MKILFLTVQDLFGRGPVPERAPGYTLQHYLDQGDSLTIVTNHPRNLKYLPLGVDVVMVPRLPWSSPLARLVDSAIFFPIWTLFSFLRNRARFCCDLLYGYEVHGILAGQLIRRFLGARPSAAERVPFVRRFQGTVMHPVLRRPAGAGRLWALLKKWDHLVALRTAGDLTIMTDDGTFGDLVLKEVGGDSGSVVFWRNGTPAHLPELTREAARTLLGLPSEAFVYLTMSRLASWKRVDRAIRAFALLSQNSSRSRRLVIVGDGAERESLERLSCQLGLEKTVIFTGEVPHSKTSIMLEASDVFLSFYDLSNVGNPLLEALRAAKPILTLNTGDTKRLIAHGKSGLLMETFSPEEASGLMARLENEKGLLAALSEGARQCSVQFLWSWPERLQAEREAISHLVEGQRVGV